MVCSVDCEGVTYNTRNDVRSALATPGRSKMMSPDPTIRLETSQNSEVTSAGSQSHLAWFP